MYVQGIIVWRYKVGLIGELIASFTLILIYHLNIIDILMLGKFACYNDKDTSVNTKIYFDNVIAFDEYYVGNLAGYVINSFNFEL